VVSVPPGDPPGTEEYLNFRSGSVDRLAALRMSIGGAHLGGKAGSADLARIARV
jgi:hypothetical protein